MLPTLPRASGCTTTTMILKGTEMQMAASVASMQDIRPLEEQILGKTKPIRKNRGIQKEGNQPKERNRNHKRKTNGQKRSCNLGKFGQPHKNKQ